MPLPDHVLQQEWLEPWASGSEHFDVEVSVALMDKADSFVAQQHIPTLKRLVDGHLLQAPVQQSAAKLDALEVDEFNLFLKQLDYDETVFENWQKKCVTVYAAREHALLEFKLNRRLQACDLASNFLNKCSKLSV